MHKLPNQITRGNRNILSMSFLANRRSCAKLLKTTVVEIFNSSSLHKKNPTQKCPYIIYRFREKWRLLPNLRGVTWVFARKKGVKYEVKKVVTHVSFYKKEFLFFCLLFYELHSSFESNYCDKTELLRPLKFHFKNDACKWVYTTHVSSL